MTTAGPLLVDVLVVGAGHAASVFARAARELGYAGSILLVGEEAHLPYERPALSKEMLRDPAYVHPPILAASAWEELHVELMLGRRIVAVDEAARSASLDDGSIIQWDRLVLATGARPRRLPGPVHPARHVIRTIDDALAVRARLGESRDARLVIVGAGPVGLEVAASLRPAVGSITVVEAANQVMSRIVPRGLGEAIASAHLENDIQMLMGTIIAEIVDGGQALDIVLSNGQRIAADLLIEGIGVIPDAPLAGERFAGPSGIEVNDCYVTANPAILAIGDVSCPPGGRKETWAHAESSGRAAARSIVGLEPEPMPPLSFWSDQFSRIQVAGDPMQARPAGRHGAAHLFERDGVIVAAAAIGASRDFAAARRLIGKPAASGT